MTYLVEIHMQASGWFHYSSCTSDASLQRVEAQLESMGATYRVSER